MQISNMMRNDKLEGVHDKTIKTILCTQIWDMGNKQIVQFGLDHVIRYKISLHQSKHCDSYKYLNFVIDL